MEAFFGAERISLAKIGFERAILVPLLKAVGADIEVKTISPHPKPPLHQLKFIGWRRICKAARLLEHLPFVVVVRA